MHEDLGKVNGRRVEGTKMEQQRPYTYLLIFINALMQSQERSIYMVDWSMVVQTTDKGCIPFPKTSVAQTQLLQYSINLNGWQVKIWNTARHQEKKKLPLRPAIKPSTYIIVVALYRRLNLKVGRDRTLLRDPVAWVDSRPNVWHIRGLWRAVEICIRARLATEGQGYNTVTTVTIESIE